MRVGRFFYVNEKTREMKWSPYVDELANPVLKRGDGQGGGCGGSGVRMGEGGLGACFRMREQRIGHVKRNRMKRKRERADAKCV